MELGASTIMAVILSVGGTLGLVWGLKILKLAMLAIRLFVTFGLCKGVAAIALLGITSWFGNLGVSFFDYQLAVDSKLAYIARTTKAEDAKASLYATIDNLQKRKPDGCVTQFTNYIGVTNDDENQQFIEKLEQAHDNLTFKLYKDQEAFKEWKINFIKEFTNGTLDEPHQNAKYDPKAPLSPKSAPLGLVLNGNKYVDLAAIVGIFGLVAAAGLAFTAGRKQPADPIQSAITAALKDRIDSLNVNENCCLRLSKELADKEIDLDQRFAELAKQQKQIETSVARHEAASASLKNESVAAQQKQNALAEQQRSIQTEQTALKERESAVQLKENAIGRGETSLKAREDAQREREKALLCRETDVASREYTVAQRESKLK